MGRLPLTIGIVLLAIAILLFVEDIVSYASYILYILAAASFFTALLSGKKIAYYLHDFHLSRKRGISLSPPGMIYLWLSIFILFMILYTIAKISMGILVKIAFISMGGKYTGIIYSSLSSAGSYLLFSWHASHKDSYLTIWGKAAEKIHRSQRLIKDAGKDILYTSEKMVTTGMDALKKFRP